jgi:hypothetical protein
MTDIRYAVRDAYQAEELSAERLQAILADTRTLRHGHIRSWLGYTAMAASVAIFVSTGLSFYHKSTITQTLLAEMATGHAQRLDMEVKTSNYGELNRRMSKAGIPIQPDDEPVQNLYQLVGARYGQLGGQPMVQADMLSKIRRERHTLYAARMNETLQQVDPALYRKDGMVIRVWKDGDMFYALARPVSR